MKMDIKCRVCLSRDEAKMYHSLSATFPEYLRSPHPVLSVLETVTSSPVSILPGWPQDLCSACLKALKDSHIFIQDFHKAQNILKDVEKNIGSVFFHTEEEIVLKVEPPDGDYLDPLLIEGDKNPQSNIGNRIRPRRKNSKSVLTKSRTKRTYNKKINPVKWNGKKNIHSVKLPIEKINPSENSVIILDHTYTKHPNSIKEELEQYSEESISSDPGDQINNLEVTETITIINPRKTSKTKSLKLSPDKSSKDQSPKLSNGQSPLQSPKLSNDKPESPINPKREVVLMSVDDVLHVRKRAPNNKVSKAYVFNCNSCPKSYSTAKQLLAHTFVHTPEHRERLQQALKCKECGHQSLTRSGLYHHKQAHNGLIYKCNECGKATNSKSHLAYHKRLVHQLKGCPDRYMCNECGKTFKHSNSLRYHLIATHHQEEKKYLCGYCGYTSVNQTVMTRHESCHTDERPFLCQVCPKGFRRLADLRFHQATHDKTYNVKCEFCGKGFIRNWNMRVHWLQHDGPHKCKLCPKSFLAEAILKFHYFYKHKIRDVKAEINEDEDTKEENKDSKTIDTYFLKNACDTLIRFN